jgi:hypothetical protein
MDDPGLFAIGVNQMQNGLEHQDTEQAANDQEN